MIKQENWFEDWFNSYFYHLLYSHRDFSEAEEFISKLFNYLALPKQNTNVLDLACGKGRHSIQINKLGFKVVGMDLSEESIAAAQLKSNSNLSFKTGDMRTFSFPVPFDIVVNLFTSFGYFKTEGDNQKVIHAISKNLKKDGILVLDYLNVLKATQNFPTEETIDKKEIIFKVKKAVEDQFIVKNIEFETNSKSYHFQEFVKMIDLDLFKVYLKNAGLNIIETFGSYNLDKFEINTSDRLILIAKKES